MPLRRRPVRPCSKDTRLLIGAIEAAGGTVTLTAGGHLRVEGPGGLTVVGSKLDDWRARKNAIADLRRHSGLNVRHA